MAAPRTRRTARLSRAVMCAALLLVSGAILTVATAWLAATSPVSIPPPRPPFEYITRENISGGGVGASGLWQWSGYSAMTGVYIHQLCISRLAPGMDSKNLSQLARVSPPPALPSWTMARRDAGEWARFEALTVQEWAYGWPAYALRMRSWVGADAMNSQRPSTEQGTVDGPWIVQGVLSATPIELPLRPIWPGFALNTIFYAAMAWGLWQLPLALRRRRRRAKGKCIRCGYDRAGLAAGAACPECGSPVA